MPDHHPAISRKPYAPRPIGYKLGLLNPTVRDCIPWRFMDWVNTAITGIIALVAAGIGALAVVWSTHRTLKTQVEESRRERIRAAQDEFDRALKRADKQVLTATNQLNMTAEPEHPYFTLDHGDLDDLLTYAELPAEIGFTIEQHSSALRRFNAAACWGNVPGIIGHERTVVPRWKDAQRVSEATFDALRNWIKQRHPDWPEGAMPL